MALHSIHYPNPFNLINDWLIIEVSHILKVVLWMLWVLHPVSECLMIDIDQLAICLCFHLGESFYVLTCEDLLMSKYVAYLQIIYVNDFPSCSLHYLPYRSFLRRDGILIEVIKLKKRIHSEFSHPYNIDWMIAVILSLFVQYVSWVKIQKFKLIYNKIDALIMLEDPHELKELLDLKSHKLIVRSNDWSVKCF
jgi:hypothetical protein